MIVLGNTSCIHKIAMELHLEIRPLINDAMVSTAVKKPGRRYMPQMYVCFLARAKQIKTSIFVKLSLVQVLFVKR